MWLLYLYVPSVCSAQVCHCTAMDRQHSDRRNQGVRQLFVPVLQPLDKLGHLQVVLALFTFMDSLMGIAVVWWGLQRNQKAWLERKKKSLQRAPRITNYAVTIIVERMFLIAVAGMISIWHKVQPKNVSNTSVVMFNTEEHPLQSSERA